MTWWLGIPMRMVQTNLREIDFPLDPEAYANSIAEFGANVALFNLGGVVANYPTRLPYHFRNPRVQEDSIGTLIDQLHRRGIRFIGRFDFSKVNETIGLEHPEWLYQDLQSKTVTYNGQMHCCVNGAYQQEGALEILAEALKMYPLDGVFFNMIGYQTHDYSGVYHGFCQCQNCRSRFFAFCGETLPTVADQSNPVYRQYLRFCDETSRELYRRIRDGVKGMRADCAICTYTNEGVDVVRSEANSSIHRSQPEFVYDASLNVRRVRSSWSGLAISNAAVHFIDFPYRHAAVSPALTARRLAQDFVHGGWLDYYVIGRLEEQHDRTCLPLVRQLFHLHRQAETWLGGTQPLADVCLIEAGQANPSRNPDELLGLVTLLSEAHILYDVVDETALPREDDTSGLARYPLVIVPDIPYILPVLASKLNRYVEGGGQLLLTGRSGTVSSAGQSLEIPALHCSGVSAVRRRDYTPGAYFEIANMDRLVLSDLGTLDWIPMDSAWLECSPVEGAQTYLRYVPVGMYGPPEKCYYTEITNHPGIIVNQAGSGACTVLPWQIGSQYGRFPTHAITGLFLTVLEKVLKLPKRVRLEAPPFVELAASIDPKGETLVLGLVNLSGQNDRAIHAPVPIHNIRIHVQSFLQSSCIESLVLGELSSERMPDGSLVLTLPSLDLLDLIRIY